MFRNQPGFGTRLLFSASPGLGKGPAIANRWFGADYALAARESADPFEAAGASAPPSANKEDYLKISASALCAVCFLAALGRIPAYADEKSDLAMLQRAYPGAFEIIPKGIRFPDGAVMAYDDGAAKDFETLLDQPDLEDMLRQPYPLYEPRGPPLFNADPGRARPDAFFRRLYGKDEAEIRSHLRRIQWMPSLGGPWLLINTRFGVDKKLEAVIAGLEALGPAYRPCLMPPGGTFNYRPIAGTSRLSAHAFGIAVDLAAGPSHYWQWEAKGAAEYKNAIPYAIVEIFEQHGFIWGGKWYHFDTMHFEYRPELLLKAREQITSNKARGLPLIRPDLNRGNSRIPCIFRLRLETRKTQLPAVLETLR
ncbi:MAG: M15 family metallopeptidase [Treponema sp.]|nr:M15 family metallopeptidase [Treponema sp.]